MITPVFRWLTEGWVTWGHALTVRRWSAGLPIRAPLIAFMHSRPKREYLAPHCGCQTLGVCLSRHRNQPAGGQVEAQPESPGGTASAGDSSPGNPDRRLPGYRQTDSGHVKGMSGREMVVSLEEVRTEYVSRPDRADNISLTAAPAAQNNASWLAGELLAGEAAAFLDPPKPPRRLRQSCSAFS